MSTSYKLTDRFVRALAATVRKCRRCDPGAAAGWRNRRAVQEPYRKAFYRVVTNDAGGAYTIRRQQWNATTHALVDLADQDDPEYNVDHDARHAMARDDVPVNARVPAWATCVNQVWVWIMGDPIAQVGTPYAMLPALEDYATETTAQTDTWDRDDPPEGKAGVLWYGPRVVTDMTAEATYLFVRGETHDSDGGLASISAETRLTVISWGPC